MPEWITRYWIEWLFGLVIAILGACYKRLSGKFAKDKAAREAQTQQDAREIQALKDGMRALLRRTIVEDCERAALNGWCDTTGKDIIQDMYDCYSALGGNGVVTPMVQHVMTMPSVAARERVQ